MTRMLKKALENQLNEEEIKSLYGGFDIVGDIAIIKIPENLMNKKEVVGESLLENIKNINTVLLQKTPIEGDYRIRELETIAGEDKTETFYKEHGCIFKVDLARAYFSPRLATERLRIANLVKPGEIIINLFAGIGTFSIIIAKKVPNSKIYNIDINPSAHEFALENIRLNKVSSQIIPIEGDSANIINALGEKANRVLMPLPEKAFNYLDIAIGALNSPQGIIHYYTHTRAMSREEAIDESLRYFRNRPNFNFKSMGERVVREVGPRYYQIVLDLQFFT
jgi:tRNA (guanine37-N1)-methyltransferase